MPQVRRDRDGLRGYAVPVTLIAILLFGYWLISEWDSIPRLFSAAIAAIR